MWILAKPDAQRFESVGTAQPWCVQSASPNGKFLTLGVRGKGFDTEAMVYERETGKLAWNPDGAHSICWEPSGGKVFAIFQEECYREALLGAWSWPALDELGWTRVEIPGYMYEGLTCSPAGDLLAVGWHDQGECGVEVVDATRLDHKLQDPGWEHRGSNLIEGPVFDPSGRHVLASVGDDWPWWTGSHEEEAEDGGSSPGGRLAVGSVVVFDLADRSVRRIEVAAEIAKGWEPDDPEDILNGLISAPVFLRADAFKVFLPTGEWRAYTVDGAELGNPEPAVRMPVKEFWTWRQAL